MISKKAKWVRRKSHGVLDRCFACGTQEELTVDHIVPKLFGGTSSPSNLRVACADCNCRRQSSLDSDVIERMSDAQCHLAVDIIVHSISERMKYEGYRRNKPLLFANDQEILNKIWSRVVHQEWREVLSVLILEDLRVSYFPKKVAYTAYPA